MDLRYAIVFCLSPTANEILSPTCPDKCSGKLKTLHYCQHIPLTWRINLHWSEANSGIFAPSSLPLVWGSGSYFFNSPRMMHLTKIRGREALCYSFVKCLEGHSEGGTTGRLSGKLLPINNLPFFRSWRACMPLGIQVT